MQRVLAPFLPAAKLGGYMEYLGVLAFIIMLCYMSYPDKVKKIERKVKKLEKERCRDRIMSKLIEQ